MKPTNSDFLECIERPLLFIILCKHHNFLGVEDEAGGIHTPVATLIEIAKELNIF